MNAYRNLSLALVPIALLVGCGSTDPSTPDGGGGGGGDGGNGGCRLAVGPLLPWKVGHKWTYKVTQLGVDSQKITTIEPLEPVGGTGPNSAKMANRVVTKKGAADQTISWQAPDGDKVVRYREQSFSTTGQLELEEHWNPYKLHVDATADHMADGKAWTEEYQETKRPVGGVEATTTAMDRWSVLAACEPIEVLGQSWNAIKLTKFGGDLKTYWYVPGVGKVKETGGQTEELVKFEAAP
jgi:hypothetical protein